MTVAFVHRQGAKYAPDTVTDPGFLFPVICLLGVVFRQPAGIVRAAPMAAGATPGGSPSGKSESQLVPLVCKAAQLAPQGKDPVTGH